MPAHARIVAITEYYTSASLASFRSVKAMATASQTCHATNIITGLAVSLQATALPVAMIAAGMWIAYSVDGGLYGVALAAAAMLTMVGIVVATAILTPIGMPTVPTSPILMTILPILPILPFLSISTNAMDSFVNLA